METPQVQTRRLDIDSDFKRRRCSANTPCQSGQGVDTKPDSQHRELLLLIYTAHANSERQQNVFFHIQTILSFLVSSN